jgi:hypothetical protein
VSGRTSNYCSERFSVAVEHHALLPGSDQFWDRRYEVVMFLDAALWIRSS